MNSKKAKCSYCNSFNTKKNGHKEGKQTYKCNDCNKRFSGRRIAKNNFKELIWNEYTFGKQTIREIKNRYTLSRNTITKYLNSYKLEDKIHEPRAIKALIIDSTYLRKRINTNTWCAAVFRDYFKKENIYYSFGEYESTTLYFSCRKEIERLGYTIEGITCDGNGAIRSVFNDIPIQMCLKHMKRIIVNKISHNPKTEAGEVLLALTETLIYTNSKDFKRRFELYREKYSSFYNERTYHENSPPSWTHENLRSAVLSIINNLPYLFTFEKHPALPKTSNSLEGHFSHVKDIIRIHRGIGEDFLKKVLGAIFNNNSIAKDYNYFMKK